MANHPNKPEDSEHIKFEHNLWMNNSHTKFVLSLLQKQRKEILDNISSKASLPSTDESQMRTALLKARAIDNILETLYDTEQITKHIVKP
jgi:hypothetical protein